MTGHRYRAGLVLLLAGALAGCTASGSAGSGAGGVAGSGAAPTAAYPDVSRPNAGVPDPGTLAASISGSDDEVIIVRSLDRQAIHSAALVEPDGRVTTAFSIDQDANPSATGLAGQPYGEMPSTSPVPSLFSPPPLGAVVQTDTLTGQTLSAASIRVPDRDFYAKSWRSDRLRVVIGMSAGDQRIIIMAAPPPSPP